MAINETALTVWEPDQKEFDIYRKHYAPADTSQVEWDIFLETCRTYRVSPLRRQIYIVSRWDSVKKRMVNLPQVSIGTLRLMALRTHEFEGTTEPEWGDEDGNWHKLWPKKLGAYPYADRKGFRTPKWGVAYFHEMAQKKKDGSYTKFWLEMGIHMILKCAEADALRGAFEEECGGVYLHEEMNQADSDAPTISIIPEPVEDDNEALRETASRRIKPAGTVSETHQEAQETTPPVYIPTNKAIYTKGVVKGLWSNTDGYLDYLSGHLEIEATRETVLTSEQKIRIYEIVDKAQPLAQAS